MMSMIRVKRAATGWMIRMAERVLRAELGRSKSPDLAASMALASYPISIPLQVSPLHQPNTPKLVPLNVPSGMALMMGVERMDKTSRANAANSRIVNGVAGRSMTATVRSAPTQKSRAEAAMYLLYRPICSVRLHSEN